ncbi:Catechol 2,3-dioxygenase [Chitinophaga sp. CF118]|uniref:VOC family protein n=1 Tax=Chitinophaga sp. CF118 TaxID=1884367 RepID=UPI0008ED41B8|nr:VOC family protein [Chitinophaga sp. CF118]SFD48957.1 Catechol 2,3-dioxygenase [Chitinophaga sp. CF118]
MRLNHINLTVKDVPSARSFFETYMQFQSADSKPNDTLSVLNGPDGFVLVLMNERLNQQGNTSYPDAFHIGFYLKNEAEVLSLFEDLKKGGITLEQEPQRIRKTFGFYFHLQNILVEIAVELSE